jgi:hypothetical protein
MLEIQRLKIIIKTSIGDFGFDYNLMKGLNFIASSDNTSGKSSIVHGIYYALGFEELIGGSKGIKTLSYAYKDRIKDKNDNELPVLESEIQLQISNGREINTLRRWIKSENYKENLITVYSSTINVMFNKKTKNRDMYVHLANAATLDDGFHYYLEKYLSLELPIVPCSNNYESKLYLQLLFSSMFIEQKRGWSGIMSGMPIYNISDARKRVVEFLIGLETLTNERKRKDINNQKESITREWISLVNEIKLIAQQNLIEINHLFTEPKTLSDDEITSIAIIKNGKTIEEYLNNLDNQISSLSSTIPIIDNTKRNSLEENLRLIESQISEKEMDINEAISKREAAQLRYNKLNQNIEIIQQDLQDNKELKKLKNLGSEQGLKSFNDICPTCGQNLQDSLLKSEAFMNIDENIQHLESQEEILDFAMKAQKGNLELVDTEISMTKNNLNDLRRLASVIKSDLVKVKNDYSETDVYEKIQLTNEKEKIELVEVKIFEKINHFKNLTRRWDIYLEGKETLPKDYFTSGDKQRIADLRKIFVELLKNLGYSSTIDLSEVSISKETYLPEVKGFDMRFDSSASDNIRGIWAFTIALLGVSSLHNGNHQKILIYDEPKQQNIVDRDFKIFLEKIIELSDNAQIIIGQTVKDSGIQKIIKGLNEGSFNYIDIGKKGFVKYSN